MIYIFQILNTKVQCHKIHRIGNTGNQIKYNSQNSVNEGFGKSATITDFQDPVLVTI